MGFIFLSKILRHHLIFRSKENSIRHKVNFSLEDKAKFLEKNAGRLGLSLNVYGKVDEIYNEDENEYKANAEAVLKLLKRVL